ncbi:MAG: GMC family oxidoreductase [Anaerolineae bacterium]
MIYRNSHSKDTTVTDQTLPQPFTPRQMETLRAICDTFVPALAVAAPDPSGFFARSASAMHLPQHMAEILTEYASERLDQVRLVLDLLDQPLVNSLLGGVNLPFRRMDINQRTATLRDWAESRLDLRRGAYLVLKRLALLLFYTLVDANGKNPNWEAIGYPGPKPAPHTEKPLKPLEIHEEVDIETEVVVIGSGAGGSVVAAELAAAGYSVLVLEKGGYHAEADFDGLEVPSQRRTFEKGGFMATDDLSLIILAGSTLGGGTTVNWAASLRTPEHVLREWEESYKVTGYTGTEFQHVLNTVSQRLHVNRDQSPPNERHKVLIRGAEALGLSQQVIPRNVDGCDKVGFDCGFCGFGCPYSAKQSTLRTYLQDAAACGASIVTHADIRHVLIEDGRAVGVEGLVRTVDGRRVKLTARAKIVVSSAGSLQTPALLMRSGLTNIHLGRNLHLHPSTGSFGFYAEPINGWQGVMMSHYITDFSNLDGSGYGVTIESAPQHTGLTALVYPFLDGLQHKQAMKDFAHISNILVINRDRDGGEIALDRHGEPIVRYKISPYDRKHLLRGVVESIRIHHAAGAARITAPYHRAGSWQHGEDINDYIARVEFYGLPNNGFVVGSAHQMSSCRMGGDPSLGAIDPSGESFEVRNLFVADGSALPTASGVNPMLTIMAVSYQIAQAIKERLSSKQKRG